MEMKIGSRAYLQTEVPLSEKYLLIKIIHILGTDKSNAYFRIPKGGLSNNGIMQNCKKPGI